MTPQDVKKLLIQELPQIIEEDQAFRYFILDLVQDKFAPKQKTEDRFTQILQEMQRDREESERRWKESERQWKENERRWEGNERRWEESERRWKKNEQRWEGNERRWEEMFAEIKQLNRKYDSTIGALGSRWGLHSEQSFRTALKSILEESFEVQVLNITEYDDEGEVFGIPDQIELDIIIQNGLLLIVEIKSSMSKNDMHIFARKVAFYEKRHQREARRKIVISPMINDYALPVAERFGIELFSYAEDVETG